MKTKITSPRRKPGSIMDPGLRHAGMTAIFLSMGFIFAGCNLNPFNRARDASSGGATGTFIPGTNFVIFYNELVSGGGAFEYPGSENQSLTFNDTSNPISRRSIRYSWTGGLVSAPGCTPNPTPLFAGFDLMHTPTLDTYNSTLGRDFHQANYGKVTFYVRGRLTSHTVLKIEVAAPGSPPGCLPPVAVPCLWLHDANSLDTDDGANAQGCGHDQMTGDWDTRSIFIPPGYLAANRVKDFFKATFVFNKPFDTPTGQGGTVYFDAIQYQP